MFIQILGIFGIIIYIFSTVLQAIRVVKTRNATSYNWVSLGMWLLAGVCMISYNFLDKHGLILLARNLVNLACNSIIFLVKLVESISLKK